MQYTQNEVLTTLREVGNFMTTNAASLEDLNTNGARATLDAMIGQLTGLAETQSTTKVQARGETTKQQSLRNELLQKYMAPIAAAAKARLSTVPEFSSLKMPKPTITAQALITAAAAMGNAAAPYKSTFTDLGLKDTFLTDLATAATTYQNSLDGRSALKTTGVGATAGAKSSVTDARKVLNLLNAHIAPRLAGNPSLLATWNNVRKIAQKPGVPVGSTKTPTPTPTPVPTPTPATAPAAVVAAGAGAGAAAKSPVIGSIGPAVASATVAAQGAEHGAEAEHGVVTKAAA